MELNPAFWSGRRVLLTGHTGFKGGWLALWLHMLGANVRGYALPAATTPSLWQAARLAELTPGTLADIRDSARVGAAVTAFQPDVVLHLAAQPIVRESYRDPRGTYETNVMGTVNLLECVRQSDTVASFLNVTTDKVYENKEWCWGYRENEPLDGYDPYSNSKSCSELVTHSYAKSFLAEQGVAVSTARAGNVIGGGDFAQDRIVPDCIRAAIAGETIEVRNPNSTRPYQHVLEPLYAYLMIAARQAAEPMLAGWYNVGPDECDCLTTGDLVDLFCKAWGDGLTWETHMAKGPHEANFLKLDCSKIKRVFEWQPTWHIGEAIEKTVAWAKAWQAEEDIAAVMEAQIREFTDHMNQRGE